MAILIVALIHRPPRLLNYPSLDGSGCPSRDFLEIVVDTPTTAQATGQVGHRGGVMRAIGQCWLTRNLAGCDLIGAAQR
jgi:hypothetical protein